MRVNFVSFTDYKSELEVYNLNKMDLFAFLLVEVIKKGEERFISDVLLDLDITKPLLYLYQNSFYYLLDNKLIETVSNSEDINKVLASEVKFTDFGRYCLINKTIPGFEKSEEKRVIYNYLNKQLVSENVLNDSSNVCVIDERVDFVGLINNFKKEIFSRYSDDFALNYRRLEADPYYYSLEVNEKNLSDEIKKVLDDNKVKINSKNNFKNNDVEFFSSNFKCDIYYGKEEFYNDASYCLIVDSSREFEVIDNKIYVGDVLKELSKYSFVNISNKCSGYIVGNANLLNNNYLCLKKEHINDCSKDIKKYLMHNKKEFSNVKIIEKLIDLL